MVKSRFTSTDLTAIVKNLRNNIIGLRVANVYDINGKTYLLKLAQPDRKVFLLLESGIRIHTTDFSREKSHIPSVFTLKLRKHIRTKRVEDIQQLGVDRVVMLTFGTGASAQHLIVEFYASGNIILTDTNFEILTLLRTHKYEEDVIVATHQVYPFSTAKPFKKIEHDVIVELLVTQKEKNVNEKGTETLKVLLVNSTDLGATIIEHCIISCGLNPNIKMTEYDSTYTSALISQLMESEKIIDKDNIESPKGYITLKRMLVDTKEKKEKKQKKKKGKKTS